MEQLFRSFEHLPNHNFDIFDNNRKNSLPSLLESKLTRTITKKFSRTTKFEYRLFRIIYLIFFSKISLKKQKNNTYQKKYSE